MPKHPDFVKIYNHFQERYCTGKDEKTSPKGGPCEKGKDVYHGWLNTHGLDDTKPYGRQDQKDESFRWAESSITLFKEDDNFKYYKCEALFPLSSMNNNIYTEDELVRGTRLLAGVNLNLNHTGLFMEGVTVADAEEEDGAAEVILKVSKVTTSPLGFKYVDMFDHSPDVPEEFHIYHVSIEASCKAGGVETDAGWTCDRLFFTGLAALTKKVLPGVPLTRFWPVESMVEEWLGEGIEMSEKPEDTEPTPTLDSLAGDIDYMRGRIGDLWDSLGSAEANLNTKIEGVNQRIDDLVALIGRESIEDEECPDCEEKKMKAIVDMLHDFTERLEDLEDVVKANSSVEPPSESDEDSPIDGGQPDSEEDQSGVQEPEGDTQPQAAADTAKEKRRLIERVREYQTEDGLTQKEAWRLAAFELLDELKKNAEN